MKYLKKFNEELRPQTYMSAARKLNKLGHTDRANDLKDWAREMEKKEEMIKWKDRIQDYAPFGTFKMSIKNTETGRTLTGDFHLDISFDEMAFSDDPEGGISFFLGLIPTSEELINQYIELCPDYDFGNGFFWGKIFNLQFEIVDDMVQFTKWNFWDYDEDMNGKIAFADRSSANKFKTLLKKIFTSPELNYPSGYTDANSLYEKLEQVILVQQGFSADYGFDLKSVADFINTISPNEMYKTI